MSRYIDADAFEANMQNEWERNEISNGEWIHFREMINDEPTADVVPVRKGKWIRKSETAWMWTCSCCGKDDAYAYSAKPTVLQDFFCPNCGASMTEGAEDD